MTNSSVNYREETFTFHIDHSELKQYLTIPFEMPEGVERFRLAYDYPTHLHDSQSLEQGNFTSRRRLNTIDLELVDPQGRQVGASGADKREIFVNETAATPGYQPVPLTPGTWQILAGAYRVGTQGVDVNYRLGFELKRTRLFVGDLHTHTLASDGRLSAQQLAEHAHAHGLDFLAITDHNQFIKPGALPQVEGLTLIPGVEWTHYAGHANFLGVHEPYDRPFFTSTLLETQAIFQSARERGATIVVNHPADEGAPFTYNLETLPFDLIEVWNGPMRPSNLKAIYIWNELLKAGRKIPAVGGSDYHYDRFAQILGGPVTCIYAQSASVSDLLAALRAGHSYIAFMPEAARLNMHCGDAMMGESLTWQQGMGVDIKLSGLVQGDVLKLVTAKGAREVFTAPAGGDFEGCFEVEEPGFVRLELWQSYAGLLPAMPVLVSNPIWFD